MHQTLEDQIIELKDKNESKNHSLNELEAELVSRAAKIDELKAEIHDLTTPIDTRLAPPTAYAKVIGNAYFQLKVSSSILGPNVQTLRRESFVGAIDCVRQAKQELKRRGLIVNRNGTNVIARSHIDEVFDLLHQIKARQTNVVLTNRNEWLDEQIAHWRSRRQTAQSEGKLFELEYIRRHEELTPWALVPNEIKNELNEMVKDTGIDAVILDEKQITKIVQLKYKRTPRNREIDTIRMNELAPFISKCSQPRYQTMDKHLVLNGCRLGSHIRRALEAMHISVEVI